MRSRRKDRRLTCPICREPSRHGVFHVCRKCYPTLAMERVATMRSLLVDSTVPLLGRLRAYIDNDGNSLTVCGVPVPLFGKLKEA